ncbi:MAG: hypothetical protein A3G18_02785 [Rhodospirillales bacterium RIFCSPLOWO2_12_FULL_58_28]|nr:MAG: hypothetical protein A3H92_00750 [Rhodospirillales bacterium RIFCSPLOWO2_02_FULL_58_16]OHC77088.1 MAG: hypothetical protein A3G18_02785 [Rhodospirillales bacterium RIFCSPLOWO2_12_FULL_58_28]
MCRMFVLKTLIKAAVLPPGLFIVMLFAGLAVIGRRRRPGMALIAAAAILLLVLSLPVVAVALADSLVKHSPLDPTRLPAAAGDAGAIVVLTAGITTDSPEYGGDVAGMASVQRALYAAFLHKKTNLPILVVGGKPRPSTLSESEAVRRLLENERGASVRWLEEQAKDTEESAANSFAMLRAEGVKTILLVTHVYHMRRAEFMFTGVGFRVIPAAVGFRSATESSAYDLLPSASALSTAAWAINEWLGLAWGKMKA